jgi:GAF domain-containing protein
MEHLLARLRAATGATRVAVWVHEASTEMVVPFHRVVSPSGEPPPEHPRLSAPVTLSQSHLLSAVIRDRQPVVARADGRRKTDKECAAMGIRSGHGEPLIQDGEVIGVLTIEPAAAASAHLLRQVAPKLAAAVAEAWARRSDRRQVEQAAVLLGLIESAAKADSMRQLLGVACRQLSRLSEVERACIFLLDDAGNLVPRMAAYADGRRDPTTWKRFRTAPVGLEITEAVLRTGEPVAADRDSGMLSPWWVENFGAASILAVPLGRTPLTGVLTLDSSQVRPFPEDVRRLAVAAGVHLGGVIEQARASQARETSLKTAQTVRQLLVEGAGATEVTEPADIVARAVQRLARTDRSAAYLLRG